MTFVLIGVAGYLGALALALLVMVALGRAARHADDLEARFLANTHATAADLREPLEAPRRARSVLALAIRRAMSAHGRLSRFAHPRLAR